MARKEKPNAFEFNYKDSLTNNDYQKIIIHQNHAIIRLLQNSMTGDVIVNAFNMAVIDEYREGITPFVDFKKGKKKDPSNLKNKKDIERYNDLKRRFDAKEEGIDEEIRRKRFQDYFPI